MEPVVPVLAELIGFAGLAYRTSFYVNDNYEDFTATVDDLVRQALDGERPDLVEPIVPPGDADFLQKVRHSAFYSTALTICCARGASSRSCSPARSPRSASSTRRSTPTSATLRSAWCATRSPTSIPSWATPRWEMMRRNMRVDVVEAASVA